MYKVQKRAFEQQHRIQTLAVCFEDGRRRRRCQRRLRQDRSRFARTLIPLVQSIYFGRILRQSKILYRTLLKRKENEKRARDACSLTLPRRFSLVPPHLPNPTKYTCQGESFDAGLHVRVRLQRPMAGLELEGDPMMLAS